MLKKAKYARLVESTDIDEVSSARRQEQRSEADIWRMRHPQPLIRIVDVWHILDHQVIRHATWLLASMRPPRIRILAELRTIIRLLDDTREHVCLRTGTLSVNSFAMRGHGACCVTLSTYQIKLLARLHSLTLEGSSMNSSKPLNASTEHMSLLHSAEVSKCSTRVFLQFADSMNLLVFITSCLDP